MMNMGNVSGMGIGGFGFGWIFMILFWALVIIGIIYVVKGLAVSNKDSANVETAENVLKRRYASGEINKEEYHDKMSVIHGLLKE